MKLGFFAYSLSGAGPRTRARTLIEALANRTDHKLVVVTGPDEDYNHPRVERRRIDAVPTGLVAGISTVRRAFTDVDVVHVPVNIYQVMYVRAVYHAPLSRDRASSTPYPIEASQNCLILTISSKLMNALRVYGNAADSRVPIFTQQ